MTSPRISVLLPVYNARPYLQDAIQSILSQSYSDFELLILDDASNDGSGEIVDELATQDVRIRVLRSECNLGLSRQLNRGVDEASGDYLARMDADDIALPHRFATQRSIFDKHPDIGICGSLVDEMNELGERTGYQWDLPALHDDIASLQFLRCGFNHPSVLIRKSVLKQHGLRYREDFRVAQDYELWCRILRVTKGTNVQQSLLHYRRFSGQLSQASSVRKWDEVNEIRASIRALLGLADSDFHRKKHHEFCDERWPQQAEWFVEMVQWLNTVYLANCTSKAFPVDAFGRMLAERLYLQCHMAARRGFDARLIFRQAIFSCHKRLSFLQSLRTSCKSFCRPADTEDR